MIPVHQSHLRFAGNYEHETTNVNRALHASPANSTMKWSKEKCSVAVSIASKLTNIIVLLS